MRLTRPGAEAAARGATPKLARNSADALPRMGLTRIGANATLGQPVSPSLAKPPGDKRMRRSVRYALVLFAGFPALLGAQGFGIYEQGACSMGRAGTGVAAPCSDGSAIFFSPVGLPDPLAAVVRRAVLRLRQHPPIGVYATDGVLPGDAVAVAGRRS